MPPASESARGSDHFAGTGYLTFRLHLRSLGCFREVGDTTVDWSLGRDVLGLAQAAVMGGDGLLDVLGKVVPQMPPIGHLDRLGCPAAGSLGIGTGTVSANHLNTRVLA